MKEGIKERAKDFKPSFKINALKRTLSRALEKHELSQSEVCRRCGIKVTTFNGWLSSIRPLDTVKVLDVALFFKNVCKDEIYGNPIYLLTGNEDDQAQLLKEFKVDLEPLMRKHHFKESDIDSVKGMDAAQVKEIYVLIKKIEREKSEDQGPMLFYLEREIR